MSVNFNIHHIFPRTLYQTFGPLLREAGFFREATGNKIGLLVEQTVIDALRDIPDSDSIFAENGFGLGIHDSNHSQYTNFLRGEFGEIQDAIKTELLNPANTRLALADLHDFARKISAGEITRGGQVLDTNSSFGDIMSAWNSADGRTVTEYTNQAVEALNNPKSNANDFDKLRILELRNYGDSLLNALIKLP